MVCRFADGVVALSVGPPEDSEAGDHPGGFLDAHLTSNSYDPDPV